MTPESLAEDRARALMLTPVSRETAGRLDRFVALLLQWQAKINLVAASTLPALWTRHVADSLQLLELAPQARVWVDLGSGGGFPGLVVGCALAEKPGCHVHLVDSNQKKAAFLREAVRITGAPATVHPMRIETFVAAFTGPVDVVTARALAPIESLLAQTESLMAGGAKALLLKGQDVEVELTKAAKYWNINHLLIPSRTNLQGRIVVISKAERRL
ncbi:MAG: 16S rRNA (guanine(527)-N(7))-methyltransferase RsmG [Rhizobiales bacterium]|nr:16S rRNA (guanine(527)-N(7))-methyltransferase RsmG [Hyphomicrobiales bacterium]